MLHPEAGGCAAGVFDDGCTRGAEGLQAIGGGHGPADFFEEAFDLDHGVGVFNEFLGKGVGESGTGEVVFGGSKAAADQENVAKMFVHVGFAGLEFEMLAGVADGGNDAGDVIADGDVADGADTQRGELLREPGGIGVDREAGGEFVADGEEDGLHGRIL